MHRLVGIILLLSVAVIAIGAVIVLGADKTPMAPTGPQANAMSDTVGEHGDDQPQRPTSPPAMKQSVPMADCPGSVSMVQSGTIKQPAEIPPVIRTCFVPGPADCAGVVAAELAKARTSIDMQAYNFTEPQIAQALLDAKARGVNVRLISDKSGPHERDGKTEVLAMAGIPVWIDYSPRIAHNKVMVIDNAEVLTGSFNWTVSADQHNAENLVIIESLQVAASYETNFLNRMLVSETLDKYEVEHQR